MNDIPVFAVVGRVNKGKSSIIATLAEDDAVAISPVPGTTRRCVRYPVEVDGRVLFTLVDTPGFEDAPAALAWMEASSPRADQRAQRVRELVNHHQGTDLFTEERELLRPILDGALILYVVDGTKPYRENYRTEMEILRWTGRPSMALINRIGDGDHVEAWRSALGQYFKVVRDFDAHTASFEERRRLLVTFRELQPDLQSVLQSAIDALTRDRARRRSEVAAVLTRLMVRALGFTIETRQSEQTNPTKLEAEFHEHLRRMEQGARREVEALYHHHRVQWEHSDELRRPIFGEDLFARKTWSVLGLNPGQLLALYAVSGAVAGSVVDASVGGASFLTGTAIGAALGAGAGAYHLQQRFARATSLDGLGGRLRRAFSGERSYRVGPFRHPNFPFVLLDRSLLHFDAVRTRAHARNAVEGGGTRLEGEGALAAELSKEQRTRLHRLFEKLRKSEGDPSQPVLRELQDIIDSALVRVEGEAVGSPP